ncbi:Ribonucleoside-diphosphate reductase subunit alpha 1 [Collinsella intestinalis]|uniref:Ribonucleoside-diphosphate reductase n=1 Tax=Collinsella intestinalis TaxID=147207 RepID=A0A5K1IJ51_9ACTN|nr:ribonucleoside-diphosphate reductase subunit alpha [Collinsella intestinalis]VWL86334.1 Ribonucleoside-diphosphate reductase subunit alpha 1 [Collinsella intestinalis]
MTETGTPDVGFIKKRDGRSERFDGAKIVEAMRRAFEDVADEQAAARGLIAGHGASAPAVSADELEALLASIEQAMDRDGVDCVEGVQDLVERALMERGHFEVAKSYILYRHERAEKRAVRVELARAVAGLGGGIACEEGLVAAGVPSAADDDAAIAPKDYLVEDLDRTLARIQRDFDDPAYDLAMLSARFRALTGAGQDADARLGALIRAAVELTSQEAPRWEMIAARLLDLSFMRHLAATRRELGIASFGELVRYLTERGLYGDYILASYSVSELEEAAAFMVSERDELFAYSGLDLLISRYVIRAHDHTPLESPQEMFLGIALHLAMNEEPTQRLAWVKRFYDMLSKLEVTMATPTLSNARKPDHQLSSCFIDTVPDSLVGIYRSIDNFAQVSKYGGGMGMYLGKVRATGGSIRGFEGVAGGVIRWIRVINDTAVAVDQLGMRQGAVAVYLDAWHRDLPEFLNLRTNNGDDRMKAHDVFPAVCYPDLFWRMAEESLDQDWHLMCPHDILQVKGYALEDFYGDEWERRYRDCVADPRISKRRILIKDLVRLILKSAVETGTPFAFMRDTVNRANPNGHEGVIYCSNLCTEIAQNTSAIEEVTREVVTEDGDTVVVTTTRPGDFVVCNLASLSLGRLPVEDDEVMGHVIETAVRALDNVIDLNFYALPYARITNHRYRSIGLGVSGYHHMLARRGISWESEDHLAFADEVFERINYHAIRASERLAEERGAYGLFEGSDWQTGAYFAKRGYCSLSGEVAEVREGAMGSERWGELAEAVARNGVRNAYLLAIAPTSSTSILSGTTPGIDPIMRKFFLEEKKGSMLPRVAPELSPRTYWYYKPAHYIEQTWSVRAAGVRQRHIDQAQSMNLYITNDYTLRQVLRLYLEAWHRGVKTIYYVRSKSLEVEECESCSA